MKKSIFRPSFCLFLIFTSALEAKQLVDRVAAVVGDQPLLHSDVEKFQNEIKKSPGLANIFGVDANQLTFPKALDHLIEEKIIELSVKELSLSVSEAEVDSQIAKIASQNKISVEQLKGSLAREGVSFETYRGNLRKQLERRNLFERELRARGQALSEDELRSQYFKGAPQEFKLTLVPTKSNKKSTLSYGQLMKSPGGTGLDWTDFSSLSLNIQTAIKGAKAQSVNGPVNIEGAWTLILVEDIRQGDEETFQKNKQELASNLQGQDFQKRLDSWLDRKKKEFQIVVNPL